MRREAEEEWPPPEQYEVVFEGRHVERIYLANPHDKAGLNWYWGVNWFERPRETAHTSWDGYADSRDAAIVDAGAILPRSAV